MCLWCASQKIHFNILGKSLIETAKILGRLTSYANLVLQWRIYFILLGYGEKAYLDIMESVLELKASIKTENIKNRKAIKGFTCY